MAVQRFRQVCHRLHADPDRQRDDALLTANGDTRSNGDDFAAGHRARIDLHEQTAMRRGRKSVLSGGFFCDLPLPVVICFQRYVVFPAPGFYSNLAAAALLPPSMTIDIQFAMREDFTSTTEFYCVWIASVV